jgi:quinoprotein glucose dehydrogenase
MLIRLFLFLTLISLLPALPPGTKAPGKIEGTASEEDFPAPDPDKALLSTITWPEEMKARVYAKQPDALNVTAIAFDEQNRLYLAETHRFDRGIEDNRRNQHWLRDEIALTSTAERLAMYQKHAGVKPLDYYTKYSEKIRVLVDDDHDGVLDRSQLYADGFNDPLDGTAAGIFAANGKVYFACIPHVWMLEDTDGDLKADTRKSLQEGYGISVSLSGHDLNGFTFGPDGRIYFTIGDRGYNLKTADGRHLYDQYAGAIFRMEPDGSGLEVVHSGLRNPKEIAFDQYGSAFSVDNNADMGDKARLVYMVEGADSGWNRGNQNLNNFRHAIDVSGRHRIPWMEEKPWEKEAKNRPAAYLPPADHISVGPSGLTYNPGTGLAQKWDNNFFICDYRGGGSEIIAFEVEPDGAGFHLKRNETFIKGFLNTDVEFGYDGRVYASDFTGGWKTYDLGNIFVFENPRELAKPETQQVRTLFAEGFEQREAAELAKLLRHPDYRVRQRAQFALAKDPKNSDFLIKATATDQPLLTRLHGLWGLGQLARKVLHPWINDQLLSLTKDSHWRIRGQAAQALGDAGELRQSPEALRPLLKDEHPNVRLLAAIALGKVGFDHFDAFVELLTENNDKDPYLRHAAIQGLYLLIKRQWPPSQGSALSTLSTHPSPAVRRGAVLVLRKLKHGGIANFLKDSDPSIVIETIQAINDAYIEEARPALAELTSFLGQSTTAIDNRIINAMFRVGGPENLTRLLAIAKNGDLANNIRIEALFALQRWENPPAADPTTGKHRPLSGDRSLASHLPEITTTLNGLLETTSNEVLAEVIRATESFDLKVSPEVFLDHFTNRKNPSSIRLAVLKTLEKIKPAALEKTLTASLDDPKAEIRTESFAALARLAPVDALASAETIFQSAKMIDQQSAVAALGTMAHPGAATLILTKLQTIKEQPPAIHLDLLEAAEKLNTPQLKEALKNYQATLDPNDPLSTYAVALEGGDVSRGRAVFYNHGAAQCTRCHKGQKNRFKGGVAGPHLKNVGLLHKRDYLLESLFNPSAQIAPGYGTVSVTFKDGKVIGGTLHKETAKQVTITDLSTGKKKTYPRSSIAEMSKPLSTMPPMNGILTKAEARDLIAYLASLKSN